LIWLRVVDGVALTRWNVTGAVIALQPTGVESCLQGGGRLKKRWKPARCASSPIPLSSHSNDRFTQKAAGSPTRK